MGRGPNRPKIVVQSGKVFVKVWLDTRKADISLPDHKEPLAFKLVHYKNIPVGDLHDLCDCLLQLEEKKVIKAD